MLPDKSASKEKRNRSQAPLESTIRVRVPAMAMRRWSAALLGHSEIKVALVAQGRHSTVWHDGVGPWGRTWLGHDAWAPDSRGCGDANVGMVA